MILKAIYKNRFYFWLLFLSMTFISYMSIYQSLVVNRTYTLVPVYFLSYMSLFSIFQLLAILMIVIIFSGFKLNEVNNQALKVLEIRRNIVLIYGLGLFLFILVKFIQENMIKNIVYASGIIIALVSYYLFYEFAIAIVLFKFYLRIHFSMYSQPFLPYHTYY